MSLPPQAPIVLTAAIIAGSVGSLALLYRDTPGARQFGVLMFGVAIWALADGFVLLTGEIEAKQFWDQVSVTVASFLPVAWLATILAYTGRDHLLTRRRLGLLLIEPVAFAALVWTGDPYGLVYASLEPVLAAQGVAFTPRYGPVFLAHVAFVYLLIVIGAAYLVRLNFHTSQPFRRQGTALLLAVFSPVFAFSLRLFDVLPPGYDLTSSSLVLGGLLVGVAIFRGRLFTVSPGTRELGREAVIDGMDDQVVIVNDDEQVVDVNPAAASLFDVDRNAVVGDSLSSVSGRLADAIEDGGHGGTEIELDGSDGVRYYDVRVSRLYRGYGAIAGRLVSLRDVTDRRQREQRLDVLNRLLRHNIRNEMNVVQGNADLLNRRLEHPERCARLERIRETVDTVLDRSEKIGRLTRTLSASDPDRIDLSRVLRDAAADVREREPEATFRLDVPDDLVVTGGTAVELAFDELFENAAVHAGDAPIVEVTANRTDDGYVEVRVSDDGPGIDEQERAVIEEGRETALSHGSGVGLWVVHWVVREFGGTVSFDEGTDGCTVVVRLPAADRRVDAPSGVVPRHTAEAGTGSVTRPDASDD